MENALVIVESPAKARTIEKYLGAGYRVTASTGHLRDLPKSTIGVDISADFTPDYEPIAAKSEIIDRLQKEARKADRVPQAKSPDQGLQFFLSRAFADDRQHRVRNRVPDHAETGDQPVEALDLVQPSHRRDPEGTAA